MDNKKNLIKLETLKKNFRDGILQHRGKLDLTQEQAAELIGKSVKTYERMEQTGDGVFYLYNALKVFQALDFSTLEIIQLLGLPPLKLEDVKKIYQNEDTLKEIEADGIFRYIEKNRASLDQANIARLLNILSEQNLDWYKRRNHPH